MKTNFDISTPQINYRSIFTTLMLITLFLCFSAFKSPSISSMSTLDIIELEEDIEKFGKITWYLVKEVDPYSQETLSTIKTAAPVSLMLDDKNRFAMKGDDLKQYGYYQIDKEQNTLTLDCFKVDDKVLSRSQRTSYIYQIKSYGKAQMVLEWQGRHGKIQCHYIRIKRSEFGIDFNV